MLAKILCWISVLWWLWLTADAIPIDNGLVFSSGNESQLVVNAPSITATPAIYKPVPAAPGQQTVLKKVCSADLDLVVVLDGSSSIGEANFQLIREFLSRLIASLSANTHVALVQFSGTPRLEFGLDTYPTTQKIQDAFLKLPYLTGTTKIGLALDFTREKVLTQTKGNRPDIKDIVLVITDGQSQDDTKVPAEKIRALGAETIAVGITSYVDDGQLLEIAGSPSRVFKITDFSKLDENFKKELTSSQFCQEVPVTPAAAPTEAPVPVRGGQLDVACNSNSIIVTGQTRKTFEGHVYVKGYYANKACRTQGDNTQKVSITIPFNNCGTARRRSLDPRGIFVENTIIIKFHPIFETKVDRAFRVSCFYMESEKTVSTESELEVSALATQAISQQFPMPTCRYSLHTGSPEGPTVRFVTIGQPIFHVWECDSSRSGNLFAMKVHSCTVDDGHGNRITTLNSKGCAVDKHVLGNLEYNTSRMFASKETHAFKFADKSELYFQCQITLCVKLENGCPDTPPKCPEPQTSRGKRLAEPERKSSVQRHRVEDDEMVVDVKTPLVTVLDPSDQLEAAEPPRQLNENQNVWSEQQSFDYDEAGQEKLTATPVPDRRSKSSSSDKLCVQEYGFILLSGSCFVSVLTAIALAVACRMVATRSTERELRKFSCIPANYGLCVGAGSRGSGASSASPINTSTPATPHRAYTASDYHQNLAAAMYGSAATIADSAQIAQWPYGSNYSLYYGSRR